MDPPLLPPSIAQSAQGRGGELGPLAVTSAHEPNPSNAHTLAHSSPRVDRSHWYSATVDSCKASGGHASSRDTASSGDTSGRLSASHHCDTACASWPQRSTLAAKSAASARLWPSGEYQKGTPAHRACSHSTRATNVEGGGQYATSFFQAGVHKTRENPWVHGVSQGGGGAKTFKFDIKMSKMFINSRILEPLNNYNF